jgi:hypothetical protein
MVDPVARAAATRVAPGPAVAAAGASADPAGRTPAAAGTAAPAAVTPVAATRLVAAVLEVLAVATAADPRVAGMALAMTGVPLGTATPVARPIGTAETPAVAATPVAMAVAVRTVAADTTGDRPTGRRGRTGAMTPPVTAAGMPAGMGSGATEATAPPPPGDHARLGRATGRAVTARLGTALPVATSTPAATARPVLPMAVVVAAANVTVVTEAIPALPVTTAPVMAGTPAVVGTSAATGQRVAPPTVVAAAVPIAVSEAGTARPVGHTVAVPDVPRAVSVAGIVRLGLARPGVSSAVGTEASTVDQAPIAVMTVGQLATEAATETVARRLVPATAPATTRTAVTAASVAATAGRGATAANAAQLVTGAPRTGHPVPVVPRTTALAAGTAARPRQRARTVRQGVRASARPCLIASEARSPRKGRAGLSGPTGRAAVVGQAIASLPSAQATEQIARTGRIARPGLPVRRATVRGRCRAATSIATGSVRSDVGTTDEAASPNCR